MALGGALTLGCDTTLAAGEPVPPIPVGLCCSLDNRGVGMPLATVKEADFRRPPPGSPRFAKGEASGPLRAGGAPELLRDPMEEDLEIEARCPGSRSMESGDRAFKTRSKGSTERRPRADPGLPGVPID